MNHATNLATGNEIYSCKGRRNAAESLCAFVLFLVSLRDMKYSAS